MSGGVTVMSMTARIEKVEVVEQIQENSDVLSKGLDFLKSRISLLGQGQHAEYTLIVTWDGKSHRCRKRFSEFAALHDFLRERFPTGLTFDLPSKTPVRMFSPEALEDRKNSLNAYLKELCRYSELINCPQVMQFFGILSGQPVVQGAPPTSGYGGGAGYGGDRGMPSGGAASRGTYANDLASQPRPPYNATSTSAQPLPVKIHGAPPERQHQALAREDSGDDLCGWDR